MGGRRADGKIEVGLGTVCPFEVEDTQCVKQAALPPVKGRLREHLVFWRETILAPRAVLEVIEMGLCITPQRNTPQFSRQNQASARAHAEFVQQSIVDLMASGCIGEVPTLPYICSPLSVVESSAQKKRLVINLKHLNKYLWKQKFQYEDLQVALLCEKCDYRLI